MARPLRQRHARAQRQRGHREAQAHGLHQRLPAQRQRLQKATAGTTNTPVSAVIPPVNRPHNRPSQA